MRKNGNPAAAAAAGGDGGFDLGGCQINPVRTPERQRLQDQRLVTPVRIDVAPMAHGKWRATLDGKVLCVVTAPLVVAARLLIARGVDPTRIIEMSHGDAEAWSLRGKLSTVAATVLDGETTGQRRAKNGSPVRQNGRGPQ
jgi:hypothetical protein